MPEEVGALRAATAESRAEDDVGGAALDRFDQGRDVARVVLHVGVLEDDDVTVDVRDPGAKRRTLAAVGLPHDRDAVASLPRFQHGGRVVGRSVVHDDHLLLQRQGLDPFEDLANRGGFVVRRNDEGDPHAGAYNTRRSLDRETVARRELWPDGHRSAPPEWATTYLSMRCMFVRSTCVASSKSAADPPQRRMS